MSLAESHVAWPLSAEQAVGVREDACVADPAGPPARWVYGKAAIGFVTLGAFEYASGDRTVLAAPGAVILGNVEEHFSVRHIDARGNRRLVVTVAEDLLQGVANDAGVAPRFGPIALAPGRVATRMFALMRALARGDEDTLYPLAHAALTAERPQAREHISARDRRRIEDVVRHIEANFDLPCPLQALAEMAGLSRFRFARVFSALVGESPNQYLINTRVRAAADRLTSTKTPIAQIALEVGFNDISHFYARFRDAFGCAPRQWRLRG